MVLECQKWNELHSFARHKVSGICPTFELVKGPVTLPETVASYNVLHSDAFSLSRDAKVKSGAFVDFAFSPNSTTMFDDNPMDYGQPYPCAFKLSCFMQALKDA